MIYTDKKQMYAVSWLTSQLISSFHNISFRSTEQQQLDETDKIPHIQDVDFKRAFICVSYPFSSKEQPTQTNN